MNSGFFTWLILAAAICSLFAGCGGSGGDPTTSASSSSSTTSSTAAVGNKKAVGSEAAVAVCKRVVRASPLISASTKGELAVVCDNGNYGTAAQAYEVTKVVCRELANASPSLSSEAARKQASAACYAEATK